MNRIHYYQKLTYSMCPVSLVIKYETILSLCFISLLNLDLYVLGDDALIS